MEPSKLHDLFYGRKADLGNRVGSAVIDFFSILIVSMSVAFLGTWIVFEGQLLDELQHRNEDRTWIITSIYTGAISLLFWKDVFGSRSLGKRLTGLVVLNKNTGQPAGPLRCLARSIFTILWPVEAIMILANPGRKLGDLVAGTEVVRYHAETDRVPQNWLLTVLAVLIPMGLLITIPSYQQSVVSSADAWSEVVRSSKDNEQAKKLEAALEQRFSYVKDADVELYHEMRGRKDRFVSVILLRNEDFPGNDKAFELEKRRLRTFLEQWLADKPLQGSIQQRYKPSANRIVDRTLLF